jgi:cytochrome P450
MAGSDPSQTEVTRGGQTEYDGLPSERPPGPDGLPLLGNTLDIYRDIWSFYDELQAHGDVVSYTFANNDFTALLHPDHVQQVLLEDHEQFGKWGFESVGGDFGSEGLVQTEGEQWRRQRTIIQDAFTMDRIQEYADATGRLARDAVEQWDDDEAVALDEAFADLTLRILCHSLFDLELEGRAEQLDEITSVVSDRTDTDSLTNALPLWVPTPRNRRFKRAQASFETFVEGLIDERAGDVGAYDDLLSLLLTGEDDSGRGLTAEEVRDQMITFLFAGHETTSLALTYACLELAKNPGLAEPLREEYEQILSDRAPTFAEIPQLDATERFIKEVLRLYPPAYVLFRNVREDAAIGGYLVPEGSKVTLPQFWLHRDERFYDEPEEFRPDRWTEGFEGDLHDYAYFPFGGGPRHCIGMRFAMLELKTVLPVVVQAVDFDLLSDPDPEFSMGVTLRPKDHIRVRIHRR